MPVRQRRSAPRHDIHCDILLNTETAFLISMRFSHREIILSSRNIFKQAIMTMPRLQIPISMMSKEESAGRQQSAHIMGQTAVAIEPSLRSLSPENGSLRGVGWRLWRRGRRNTWLATQCRSRPSLCDFPAIREFNRESCDFRAFGDRFKQRNRCATGFSPTIPCAN
jgi:hypothetical protein